MNPFGPPVNPPANPFGPPAGGNSLAALEAEMARASAAGQFEQCIRLREQIKPLKLAALETQMQQASAACDFELCIKLRQEIQQLKQ